MKIIEDVFEFQQFINDAKAKHQSIGFVPTMGALHDGHLSLVKQSKSMAQTTILSVFVNPMQFGPNEDFNQYPRPFQNDVALAKQQGVDVLFQPSPMQMYPLGHSTFIDENNLSNVLCGQFRKGHFKGVLTVVFKLLSLTKPDYLFLGKKDAQQLRMIEHMVEDFNLDVQVIGCDIVREKNGLALSSRNAYLKEEQKAVAVQLSASLFKAKKAFDLGEKSSSVLLSIAKEHLQSFSLIDLQYLELRNWDDFQAPLQVTKKCVLALAAFVGKTRLIDNVMLEPR